MNACSLVIRARRDRRADVRAALDCTRGVAVEGETGAAQIVVIADYDDAGAAAQAYVALSRIDGVLSVSLVHPLREGNPPDGFLEARAETI